MATVTKIVEVPDEPELPTGIQDQLDALATEFPVPGPVKLFELNIFYQDGTRTSTIVDSFTAADGVVSYSRKGEPLKRHYEALALMRSIEVVELEDASDE